MQVQFDSPKMWQPIGPPLKRTTQKDDFLPLRSLALHRFWQHPLGKMGIFMLLPICLFMVIGPLVSGYTYEAIHLTHINQPPSAQFWFGTDDLGRDIFTRVWYGARISLTIGCLAALIDLGVGLLWGGVAGLVGGKIDELLMSFADILYSLPYLLIIILLSVFLGSGLFPLLIAITITGWITMARIVRGQMLLLKEMDFVLAAKAMGASPARQLFVHLLPNAMGPILITLTLTIPSAIFAETFLSFLGLGIQAPQASWGTMANEGLPALQYYPWRIFFPGFFMCSTLLAFHFFGEALKYALDQSYDENFS